jgi:sec-independent protein translocase protein TatC
MAKLPGAVQGARIVGERFVRSQRQANPEGRMPVMDHIRELRNRVVKMILALAVGMVVGFIFFHWEWAKIEGPFCSARINGKTGCHVVGDQLVVGAILDPFYLRVKIAFIAGLILSCPVWLYQLWAFVAPGLYTREKRWTYTFLGTAVPLFLGGAAFGYLVMPRGLRYLLGLTPSGVVNLPNVDTYLSYALLMLVGFGLCFEVPLFLVGLNLAGVLTHARFRKWRRVMIFGVFLFAGIASPSPDPITMLLLAGPCAVLVEIAELIVWANDRRRTRLHPDPYAGLADDELSPLPVVDDTEDRSRFN